MKQNAKILTLFIFLQTCCAAFAQQFREDYSKMQQAYSALNNFSCELQVRMFNRFSDQKPSEVLNSTLRKNGNQFFYTMGKNKMLFNDKCILFIDERQKQMIYTVRNKGSETGLLQKDQMLFAIDTVIKHCDSISFEGTTNGMRHYKTYSSKGLILQTDLFINENNLLQKIIYSYDKSRYSSEKVEIEYLSMKLNPVFDEIEFSEKKYAVFSSGLLKPLGIYSGYATNVIDPKDFK